MVLHVCHLATRAALRFLGRVSRRLHEYVTKIYVMMVRETPSTRNYHTGTSLWPSTSKFMPNKDEVKVNGMK